ncbi:hypothetical protein [Lysobacter gummosus]|uniref:hypothetical protein n=1 Tax=Lysobacter gummosus TaxID=262324 RepID=UPI00363EB2D8
MIRVCVIDDEPLARRGVVSLLATFDDMQVTAEYEDGITALAGCWRSRRIWSSWTCRCLA